MTVRRRVALFRQAVYVCVRGANLRVVQLHRLRLDCSVAPKGGERLFVIDDVAGVASNRADQFGASIGEQDLH